MQTATRIVVESAGTNWTTIIVALITGFGGGALALLGARFERRSRGEVRLLDIYADFIASVRDFSAWDYAMYVRGTAGREDYQDRFAHLRRSIVVARLSAPDASTGRAVSQVDAKLKGIREAIEETSADLGDDREAFEEWFYGAMPPQIAEWEKTLNDAEARLRDSVHGLSRAQRRAYWVRRGFKW